MIFNKKYLNYVIIRANMSEQEKNRQRVNDLHNAQTNPNFLVYRIQSKDLFTKKENFKESGEKCIEQKWKESFLTALAVVTSKK